LTSGSVHAEILLCSIYVLTLVLLGQAIFHQAIFHLEHGQTNRQTGATEPPTPRWRLCSQHG